MKTIRLVVVAAACVLVLPTAVAVQSTGDGARTAGKQWPAVSGDSGNSRHSTLNQITTQNIGKLGAAWTSQKFDAPAGARTMPLVHDGLMFLTAGPAVYALDAKTGARVWRFQAGPQAQMGAPGREGVAVGDGLVFVGLSDARVIALREKTGELVWNKYVGDKARDKGQVASGAPLYAGGLVSIGLSADNGWRGQVVALNGQTGEEAWRFFAVPAPGEPGAETWPKGNPIWQRGGGAVWLAGAADPDLGVVYYVTGNGVPQLSGEGRPGNNLYLCSVVAIDMKTGKLRWHYQVIRHDIWEADIAISPVLYDAQQAGGRSRKAIAAMRADGYLFMLDRESGKPLTRVDDRAVSQNGLQRTAATQPFPAGADSALPTCDTWKKQPLPRGFDLSCDFYTPASVEKPNLLTPTFGMRVAPMAYSPDTGYFYATGNAALGWLRRDENPWFFSNTFNQRVPGLNGLGHGVLAAIDSKTNKVVWKKEFRPGRPSGAMTTGGGLMFQSAPDGNVQAYDAKTGNVLWQFQIGAAGGPPLSYEIDGEQYVAAITPAGVWAFKLGGTVAQAPAPTRQPQELFTGQITDTTQVETASLVRDTGFTGFHYMTDEYAFSPYRARVKRGTQVTWRNNGLMVHTIVAQDGSWTTGPLNPADVGGVTFDKAGTYTYMCREHPWAVGQIVVTD
jgi:alcohol dehydrogenase (cytochrome c)